MRVMMDKVHRDIPMQTEDAFVQAVRESPGEASLRLMYADWLEERGDPLGEFLRLQHRLDHLDDSDAERPALEEREREFVRNNWRRVSQVMYDQCKLLKKT